MASASSRLAASRPALRRAASSLASSPPLQDAMKRAALGSRANSLIVTRFQHGAAKARAALTESAAAPRRLASSTTPAAAEASPQPPAASTSAAAASQPPPPPPPQAAEPGAEPAGEAGGEHAAQADQVGDEGARAATLASASTWLRRTIYLTAGAGATAGAAAYFYDPAPFHARAQQLYDEVDGRVRYFTEPSRDKLLPDLASDGARTLVIDLDRTLVHSTFTRATGWRIAKRPGAEAFLAYLASFYEIVVFTSNLDSYANPILDRLDGNGYISHRLYRPETHYQGGVHVKDLARLNRDLARVVVVDHDPRVVKLQRDNAVIVPEWSGDPADTALLDVIPLLEGIVREDVADVRDVLPVMQDKPVAEGVAAYQAMAAARAEKTRGPSLFGHSAAAAPAPAPAAREGEGEGDAKAGSVWGAIGGRRLLGQQGQR